MSPEYAEKPLLQGLIPLSPALGKINPTTRRVVEKQGIEIEELQKKDRNIQELHLSFTLLEILRSIKNGDIEIEGTEPPGANTPDKLILKYKQGYGPKEFEEAKGKITIDLRKSLGERLQKYQEGLKDQEKTRDEQLVQLLDQSTQSDNTAPIPGYLLKFFQENINKEYLAFERYPGQEDQPLNVLGRKVTKTTDQKETSKVIPFGGDIDLQSLTVSKQLHDSVSKNKKYLLYKPINIPPNSDMFNPLAHTENIEKKKELLESTTELLLHLAPYYKDKIEGTLKSIERKIQTTQQQINITEDQHLKEQLEQEKALLQKQQQLILSSNFIKKLLQDPSKATLDDLFESDEAKDYFTNLAGNITPIQFLDKAIMNQLGKSEFLQHGADQFGLGSKFILDTGTHLHIFGDKMFITTDDKQRVKLWLIPEVFNSQFIHVNPAADMTIWSPLIEAQLANSIYKDMVDPETKKSYENYKQKLESSLKRESNMDRYLHTLDTIETVFPQLQDGKEYISNPIRTNVNLDVNQTVLPDITYITPAKSRRRNK